MKGRMISIKIQRWRYVGMDFLTTNIAFLLFNYVRYLIHLYITQVGDNISFLNYITGPKLVLEQIFLPLLFLGVYWLSGYYNSPFGRSRLAEFSTTFFSTLFNSLLIFLTLLINDQLPTRTLNYELLFLVIVLQFTCVYLGRFILTTRAIHKLAKNEWSFNTVIIGDSNIALDTAKRLSNTGSNLGYYIIGHIPIEGEKSSTKSHTVLSDSHLKRLKETKGVDQLIISSEKGDEQTILATLYKYLSYNIPIKISPSSLSYLTSHIRLWDIKGEPFIDLSTPSMSDFQKNLKRVIDICASSLAMLILAPVYAGLAIAVKAGSPGPVFYTQERIGYHQKPFKIYKFRSMRTDAEVSGPQLSEEDDPRITKIGHFLRKYRLDEIPQFWNVLKGDMSLVGPRPEREFYIRQIVEEAPYYTLLHKVKPGVTSWGMVKYGYAKSVKEMIERSKFDLLYLSNMSVLVDFKILLHTIKTVIMGKGM